MRLTSGSGAQKLVNSREVARPRLLPRDRAVHRDVLALDVLQNPIVGRRRAADVVLGLQPVDRDEDLQRSACSPSSPESAAPRS